MEKYTMLALSTAHVTVETARLMDRDAIDNVILYPKDEAGWFVFIPDKGLEFDELENANIPADLYTCMKYACDNGCGWIMFDCAVDVNNDLTVYEW